MKLVITNNPNAEATKFCDRVYIIVGTKYMIARQAKIHPNPFELFFHASIDIWIMLMCVESVNAQPKASGNASAAAILAVPLKRSS